MCCSVTGNNYTSMVAKQMLKSAQVIADQRRNQNWWCPRALAPLNCSGRH